MTSRIEDLEAALTNPNLGDKRRAYIESEIQNEKDAAKAAEKVARTDETVRVKDRLSELETATRSAAPEKAVTRTSKK